MERQSSCYAVFSFYRGYCYCRSSISWAATKSSFIHRKKNQEAGCNLFLFSKRSITGRKGFHINTSYPEMRSLLTKIVYKGISIKEYASITTGDTISEKVSLKIINLKLAIYGVCLKIIPSNQK